MDQNFIPTYSKIRMDDEFKVNYPTPRLLTCRGTLAWNLLTIELRRLQSLPQFKKLVRKHIISLRDQNLLDGSTGRTHEQPTGNRNNSFQTAGSAGHSH